MTAPITSAAAPARMPHFTAGGTGLAATDIRWRFGQWEAICR